jgi:flagellar basal body rod protein FlgG
MTVGLFRGAASLRAHQIQVESIARNLSNLSTVGFKRETSGLRQFNVQGTYGNKRGVGNESAFDFTQGDLRRTGQTYDLALMGEGFFAIEGPVGEVYTRDGSFRLGPDGSLLTSEGHAVAWDAFIRQIDPRGMPPVIDGDGTVRQGVEELGTLRIVNFEDNQKLRPDGYGHWIAPTNLPEATATATVHQGALEESNSAGIVEMIEMISIQRQFDSMAQAMKSVEESYRRLTRPM